jgi:hypothetical protein
MTDFSGTQGVQVGNDNLQLNIWLDGHPLAVSFFRDFDPHKAAESISAMNADDVVLLRWLDKADIGAVAATVDALLKTDEAAAVSVLAEISRHRANALIKAAMAGAPGREWLGNLADATQAIGARAVTLGWADPGPLEHVSGTSREHGDDGFSRTYEHGKIYWNRRPAAAPAVAAIMGVILDHYVGSGGADGRFGLPLDEERAVGAAADGRRGQHFSGGSIYHHAGSVTEVGPLVKRYLLDRVDGHQRYPLGPEADAPASPYGTRGRMQRFRGAWDSPVETVYYSAATEACGVRGDVARYFDGLGATSSWLGFPATRLGYLDGHPTQDFEGGTIFGWPDRLVAVPSATMMLIRSDKSIESRLGFPLTAEQPAGEGDDGWQFFENGVVTVRDGNRQVWVRP